ncbi:hypothetical protein GOP47_0017852 [Adiantum capillus-veneris]|uniref:Protein decapping 5 n=1 Tax=Adiantum capillus-veneris TaxID=13818 RepID=A0A9D4UG70_ADICA|nr:hypothetical protein GOP47_0017852 [Adiantum capillus-veneris]
MADSNSPGGGGGAADSYIGSLISLTSKSEIRYEGILYTVDTANSNIALQDVRSFGTEGRKKDGPQIPASDKVYDYIIFRGTDIKDLQVKSSPLVRQTQLQQPHHDPAIISLQSQTSPMAPPVAAGNLQASAASTATTPAPVDGINPGPYSNIPSANYQASMPPLYQPYAGLGSWAMPPIPPGTNGTMGMPMYWPGYYRPPGGISHLQQQSPLSFQSPPSMPNYLTQAHTAVQQPLPAPTSMPVAAVPDANQVVLQPVSAKDSAVNSSHELAAPSMTLPIFSSAFQASTALSEDKVMAGKSALKVSSQMMSSATSIPQSSGSFMAPSSVSAFESGALLDPPRAFDSQKQPVVFEQLSVDQSSTAEPVISTASTSQVQSSANQPLLPLPVRPKQYSQPYGVSANSMFGRRGRGRGRGIGNPQSQSQFMEDFDFTAMNEKFKKDEVWGELGKADFRERGDGEDDISDEANYEEEDFSRPAPVYVKDDFFDTLSCDAFDRGAHTERTKFSEQRKIDTETFGRFSVRSRGGRGGRGGYRGNSRGGYYAGRLAGNGGRGRSFARNTAGY